MQGTISILEAAGRAGVHPATIQRRISAGELPTTRTLSGAHRINPADLERLLGRVSSADRPATVTVTADGGDGSWSVSIDGSGISGTGSESRICAESALWNTPAAGGAVTVPGVGVIRVPHRAAGQAASITLAGMTASAGGGSVSFTVRAGDAAAAEVA